MDVVKLQPGRLRWDAVTRRRWRRRRVTPRIEAQRRDSGGEVVGLGNLCLDVRLTVSRLPHQRPGWRKAFMRDFLAQPPVNAIYEPGGVMNTLFAASRLGLDATVVGRMGVDRHGEFCRSCLQQEGIPYVSGFDVEPRRYLTPHPFLEEMALCLVIVDPTQHHLFCSTFQVAPGPVFHHPSNLTPLGLQRIRDAKALYMNGYAFQECSGDVLKYAFEEAIQAKTATFFDPGPYGVRLGSGSAAERKALCDVMHRSHVILATEEEAMAVTGTSDAVEAGQKLLHDTDSVTRWVVIKLGAKGSLFLRRDVADAQYTSGFPVHVSDTVGCGDSFAAAVVYGYLHRQGERPDGVMELANAIGAITATRQGAGRNVANLSSVKALLERHLKQSSAGNGSVGLAAALDLLKNGEEQHRYAQEPYPCQHPLFNTRTQEGCFS